MQTIARQIVRSSNDGNLKFTVVDPVMCGGAVTPGNENGKWLPIKPATDGAFIMALIQWIIENKRYDEIFLSSPSLEAAREFGYNSWTNAAHLVIVDEKHPNYRKMLRPGDLGIASDDGKETDEGTIEIYMVIDKETGKPALHTEAKQAELFFSGTVETRDGEKIKVATSMEILKESAYRHDMETYAEACGIPVDSIIEVAKEFTAHGVKVATDGIGGTATSNGVHLTFGIYLLPAMMGSFNKKGGLINRRMAYASFGKGPRYNLTDIEGAPKSEGIFISRTGVRYEDTSEYKQKVAKGENPYPSKLPWHPVGGGSDNQAIYSIINQYPYQAKIMMNWMFNPLMSTPSAARKEVIEKLADVNVLPLYISFDAFMGEATYLADYVIPDTTQYENWGVGYSEGSTQTKMSKVRWPVVEPMTMKLADGRHACFENYLIDVCKEIGIPGHGEKGFKDSEGNYHPLHSVDDFFLCAIANVAFDEEPVRDISDHEIDMQGLRPELEKWKKILKPEELRKVAYVISRGGRFERYDQGYTGEDDTDSKYPFTGMVKFYVERMATSRDSYTGEYYSGVPGWYPERFADGTLLHDKFPESEWPFAGVSYKAKFRSVTMLANSKHLRDLSKTNYIEININDAKKLGLKSGDKVKLISPTGGEIIGTLLARPGIAEGTVATAFGYGHWEYGARKHKVGNKTIGGVKEIGAGVNITSISMMDPTVSGTFALTEMMTGGPSRNGGLYRIEKA